ncbi:MAG: hypothetical protein AEth_01548 [Candidatus Argoarchaeum ethanivorans]|uniref:Uncharacterized protein n=1 Tax=Candidatus Argoarchaeum ethanivorans TaxID=2608793 RepID=A0A8B3RZN8_9EURY|nr:MAG: hypothetical protein AEth_01548 [Candidatus Argoarchaeum ethanivorans]
MMEKGNGDKRYAADQQGKSVSKQFKKKYREESSKTPLAEKPTSGQPKSIQMKHAAEVIELQACN